MQPIWHHGPSYQPRKLWAVDTCPQVALVKPPRTRPGILWTHPAAAARALWRVQGNARIQGVPLSSLNFSSSVWWLPWEPPGPPQRTHTRDLATQGQGTPLTRLLVGEPHNFHTVGVGRVCRLSFRVVIDLWAQQSRAGGRARSRAGFQQEGGRGRLPQVQEAQHKAQARTATSRKRSCHQSPRNGDSVTDYRTGWLSLLPLGAEACSLRAAAPVGLQLVWPGGQEARATGPALEQPVCWTPALCPELPQAKLQ